MVNVKLNETIKRMHNEGKIDETFVMEATEKTLGGKCTKSSRYEDMNKHIDFWWESPKKGRIGVDVKGIKSSKRESGIKDDSIHWIEIQNVRGNKGWLYGEAEYIAFRTFKNIIFVKLDKLQKYTEEKVEGKDLVFNTPKDFYIPYQRKAWGRQDIVIKVPTSDLLAICDFTIDN